MLSNPFQSTREIPTERPTFRPKRRGNKSKAKINDLNNVEKNITKPHFIRSRKTMKIDEMKHKRRDIGGTALPMNEDENRYQSHIIIF